MTQIKCGRKKKYPDPKEMEKKIDEYFKWCDSQVKTVGDRVVYKPYTVSGLCLYLKITRDTLWRYEKRDNYQEIVKNAKMRIENWIEEHSLMGDTNPTVSIFNLKNNFGWKDKHEVDQKVSAEVTMTKEEKEKKLKELKERLNEVYE